MNKNIVKIGLSACVATLLLSGCSLTMQDSMNKDLKEITKDNKRPKQIDGINLPDLSKQYADKVSSRKSVSFENPISLKAVLKQLEEIDGKKYFLDRNSENIIFPVSSMKANNFKSVAQYLADTTGKTLYVDPKYSLFKDKLQIVKVKNAKEQQYNFAKIPFKLNMNISVAEALKQLKENPQFAFSINIDYEDFETVPGTRLFQDVYISYKGTNVQEFLDYLGQKLNVFINIDYDSKIVRLHKYEKQFFQLIVDNKDITGTIGGEDTAVTKDSDAKESKLAQEIKIGVYSELKESLEKILLDSISRKNNNSYYEVDDQTGSVEAYSDRRTMQEFQKKIEKFNDKYKDMIEVEVLTMEIVLSKDYLLKTGLDITKTAGSITSTLTTPFNVTNQLLDVVKTGSGGSTTNLLLQSAQEFGYVADKRSRVWKLRNHIPKSKSDVKGSRFLKNIKILDPTVDGQAEKAETETDSISEPENYSVTAHYSNNQISLSFNSAMGKLTDMETLTAGTTAVSNPITKSSRDNDDVFMKNGDVYIMEDSVTLEKSNKFEGIIPTNWIALNAIGGGSNESMVYTQKIKLVTAKKIQ